MAILDLPWLERWPEWVVRFAAWLNKPFGVSLELDDRLPWKSIPHYLNEVLFREYCFGTLYLAVGDARQRPESHYSLPALSRLLAPTSSEIAQNRSIQLTYRR